MPKVKIVWVQRYSLDDYDTKLVMRALPDDEFEDISAEDLTKLRTYLYLLPKPNYDFEPKIVLLEDLPVTASLTSIEQEIKKIEVAKTLALKKRAERLKKLKNAKEAKELARFKELQKKFEGKEKD